MNNCRWLKKHRRQLPTCRRDDVEGNGLMRVAAKAFSLHARFPQQMPSRVLGTNPRAQRTRTTILRTVTVNGERQCDASP